MRVPLPVKAMLLTPVWVAQLATSAKSFIDNPLMGSTRLNRMGLHRARVQTAARLCDWRRRRLAKWVRADWLEAFRRDGFVAIENVIPEPEFAAFKQAVLEYRGEAREMRQGDAITRRLAIDPAMLAAVPALRAFLARPDIVALFHYVASYRITPLHYVQTIATHGVGEGADPQEMVHADSFHSSLKSWLFLNDVEPDQAPFTYVPGSHKFTQARLDWEHNRSLRDPRSIDRLSARGSPRAGADDLVAMDLPSPTALAVPANTLVVADTGGFHARGASRSSVERVEIWSYARRNPFIPWLGGDILGLPGLAERRVGWLWALRDRFETQIGQPWQKVGLRTATDDSKGV